MRLSFFIIGLVLLGSGTWFLLNPVRQTQTGELEIAIIPGPGSVLTKSNGELSEVFLESIKVERIVSDKQYDQLIPNQTIKPGEPILLVTLSIQNKHPVYKIVGISAVGYDAAGVQVARTLDDILHGMAWAQLEYQEIGKITLHLNFSKSIKLIKIFGNTYQYPVP